MSAWESVTDIFRDIFSKGWNFTTNFYDKVGMLQFLIVVFGIYLSLRYIIFPLISRNSSFWNNIGGSVSAVSEFSNKVKSNIENSDEITELSLSNDDWYNWRE